MGMEEGIELKGTTYLEVHKMHEGKFGVILNLSKVSLHVDLTRICKNVQGKSIKSDRSQ